MTLYCNENAAVSVCLCGLMLNSVTAGLAVTVHRINTGKCSGYINSHAD